MRTLIFLFVVLGLGRVSSVDSYSIPRDFQVACVQLADGETVWTSSVKQLLRPEIRVGHDNLWIKSPRDADSESEAAEFVLDRSTGQKKEIHRSKSATRLVEPLAALSRHLQSRSVGRFSGKDDSHRGLIAKSDGKIVYSKRLEHYIRDLHVHGDLAVFT